MWIQRDFSKTLEEAAATRPAVLLSGARQTGKSSLLERLFPHIPSVSLDLPSEAEQAEKAPSSFLARHPPPVIFDEVQYAPALFRYLKLAIDQARREKKQDARGQYLLTGSQPLALMERASESLAGRIAILRLETLSLREIQRAYPEQSIHDFLLRGGYPELYEDPAIRTQSFYGSYVATYLERDLRSMLGVSSLRDFERFLRACAARSGQLLNKSDLARDVGISGSTAGAWLSVLQASGLVFLLEPWFANRSRSITKSPKLFLSDTGLLCYLLNIHDEAQLEGSPLLGAIWETAVYAELRKQAHQQGIAPQVYFWRDRNREVDFLIPKGGRYELIEVKWSEHPDRKALKGFKDFEAAVGADNVLSKRVICRTPNAYPLDATTHAVPLREL